jgi:hypothetical protein
MDAEDGQDLREVVSVFSGLRNLVLTAGERPVTVDLTPLCEVGQLRSVAAHGKVRLVNKDHVPQATVYQSPESRY